MNIFLIILHTLHIIAGVLWARGASHPLLSIGSTVQATASESLKFMGGISLLAVSTARYWIF